VKRGLLSALLLVTIAGCDSGGDATAPASPSGCDNGIVTCMEKRSTPPPTVIDASKKYSATVHTSRGDFVIAFVDPKIAPQTVNNFVYLAQNHFYDNLTFHRVVPGFVVQGGDPLGNGTGGPAYKLPDESNPSKWPRGTIGMASSQAGVSGSQFFITTGAAPFLETSGVYNHFGQISSGMDVVDKIQIGDKMTSIDITSS
jgi:cyclophilin family peptidyl-prolyl cis-trans isomerase